MLDKIFFFGFDFINNFIIKRISQKIIIFLFYYIFKPTIRNCRTIREMKTEKISKIFIGENKRNK